MTHEQLPVSAAERVVAVPDPDYPQGPPLHVQLPAVAGDVDAAVTAEEAHEAEHFVRTLAANQQISRSPKPTPGSTHEVVEQDGRKMLRRKRFSAY